MTCCAGLHRVTEMNCSLLVGMIPWVCRHLTRSVSVKASSTDWGPASVWVGTVATMVQYLVAVPACCLLCEPQTSDERNERLLTPGLDGNRHSARLLLLSCSRVCASQPSLIHSLLLGYYEHLEHIFWLKCWKPKHNSQNCFFTSVNFLTYFCLFVSFYQCTSLLGRWWESVSQ